MNGRHMGVLLGICPHCKKKDTIIRVSFDRTQHGSFKCGGCQEIWMRVAAIQSQCRRAFLPDDFLYLMLYRGEYDRDRRYQCVTLRFGHRKVDSRVLRRIEQVLTIGRRISFQSSSHEIGAIDEIKEVVDGSEVVGIKTSHPKAEKILDWQMEVYKILCVNNLGWYSKGAIFRMRLGKDEIPVNYLLQLALAKIEGTGRAKAVMDLLERNLEEEMTHA